MQNFTLRLKGKLFYLLTLFLFIGTLSSYGQDCGTPAADQNYCYLETIQDLINDGVTDSDSNTEIFETADSVNDTDPIDRDELLSDGTQYFIGSSSDDCTRVPVTVSVDEGPRPVNEITNGRDNFTISPCENSGFTAQDLEDLFTADAGYELEVYDTEFGETALDPGFTLNAGDSYFVGQVDDGSGSRCPSFRAAVGYDPIETPGPTAEANQTYCEGATVADLMASGTEPNTQAIRWYRSETSNSPLADDVELINGEDYFAAQVVNDRNSPFPPCETPMAERTRVVVEVVTFDAGPDVSETICNEDLDSRIAGGESGDDIFISFLDGRDLPSEVSFNPSIASLAAAYADDPLQTFTTVAKFTTPEGCTDDVEISLTVEDDFNAGDDSTGNVVCRDALILPASEEQVRTFFRSLLSSDADDDGEFSNISSITSQVNAGESGPFNSTYTVGGGSVCEDTAEFSVSIIEPTDAEAGDFDSFTVSCTSSESIDLSTLDNNNPDATSGGTFSGEGVTDNNFDPSIGPGTYTITYEVDDSQPCVSGSDSTTFEITVNDDSFNAGDDSLNNIVCRDDVVRPASLDAVRAYFLSLLSPDADPDGEFSNLSDIRARVNAGESGPFNSTYTVGAGTGCEDTAEFSASIVENTEAEAGDFDAINITCGSSDPLDLTTITNNDPEATAGGTFSGEGVTDNVFDPSIGAGTYTITYSVDDTIPCVSGSDSTTFEINVENDGGNAGDDSLNNTVCRDDIELPVREDQVRGYFISLLSDDADTDGTFTNISDITARVNAGESGPFTTTYTVESDFGCEDTAEFSATIIENTDAEAGDFDTITFACGTSDALDLTSITNNDPEATAGGVFTGEGVTDNVFDPSIGAGTYTITYSVDDTLPCVSGSDATTFEINVENDGGNAGDDNLGNTVCRDDIELPVSEDQVRSFFTSLLSDDADTDGTFSNISDITARVNAGESGPFTTTYTVETGSGCEDSAEVSASIIENTDAEAGNFDSFSITCSNDEPIDLTSLENNDSEATTGGTFTGEGVSGNSFNPAVGAGTYTITYAVDDSLPCVSGNDSTTFEITVENDSDNAGSDSLDNTVCRNDLSLPASLSAVRSYFTNLLSDDATSGGTFSNLENIRTRVNAGESGPFTTTYTVGAGTECPDTSEFSVTIIDNIDANAGNFDDITDSCPSDDPIMLAMLTNNDSDATSGGTFTGEGVSGNSFDPSIGAGTYTITYTVNESLPCVTGEDSTTFQITVLEAPVSASISRELCVTDARDLISNPAAGIAYLQSLVEEAGVDSFDPDNFSSGAIVEATRLANFIETPTSDSETFNFEYTTPSETSCEDGLISVSITINDLRDAEAGEINDQTVCSTDGMIDLTDFFTSETIPGGTFSGTGVDDNMFDSSIGFNEDGYEITYTVDDSADCITEGTSDSTTFTLFVNNGVSAGSDNSITVCRAEVDYFNEGEAREFYLNLLTEGVPTDGTFEPSIAQLIEEYNTNEDQMVFATTYTVSNESCSDSVVLTVNVRETLPAEIGDIADPDPICRNADDVDLFSFLPEDANPNGTFEGYEDGVFSPMMSGAGTFDITYTLTEDSPCTEGEASATFTITVLESAFAGMDMELSVCMDDDTQDLFSFLSVDADDNGEFTYNGDVITDGMMNPADFVAGTYTVIYTVPAENDCGEDTAEFEITVEEAPDAPIVDGNPFTFCATDGATIADLSATGTNLTYYSDEDLTMMVTVEDALESGMYYVTQRNDDGACESLATEISVTINDADTPTISEMNPSFCEFDDATIADLTDMINEAGTITWYDSADGDNALSSGTSLQDGVTYYATLFNVDTGCESSVRLAVTVTIDDDCPIIIPEGFSPNGDGLNDTFEIRNIRDKYPNFTIEIRNRFGDVVYKGNTNTPDWDGYSTEGSFGSDILPVGAYFYYLNWNDGSTEPVRGTVYLSR